MAVVVFRRARTGLGGLPVRTTPAAAGNVRAEALLAHDTRRQVGVIRVHAGIDDGDLDAVPIQADTLQQVHPVEHGAFVRCDRAAGAATVHVHLAHPHVAFQPRERGRIGLDDQRGYAGEAAMQAIALPGQHAEQRIALAADALFPGERRIAQCSRLAVPELLHHHHDARTTLLLRHLPGLQRYLVHGQRRHAREQQARHHDELLHLDPL